MTTHSARSTPTKAASPYHTRHKLPRTARAKRAPHPSGGASHESELVRGSTKNNNTPQPHKYGYEWRNPSRQATPRRCAADDLNAAWRTAAHS